ncbi:MAG TPA: efflux RND transporter periplasmic adaptor subunit [Nitrosomonas europaea]|uniref:efflux RND transporter periplasmic adaptor subunit n=1 Tax=Nitrosomonas europaea TaxID=915 RepID=UPI0024929CDF|nr:efflux RND transporter periplasmic adaptor subunit [Nitrosomonas europaea]HRN80966.1 efflux RND transporter periplasmic adaptor subunit [Nitrosomonas europaea]HRO55549.1 efflux RND transporter periplasmic adaptor subunit [Nitrosomonas europaea]HRQ07432.1 efflux RND transporter periplasmic adaptor subunit [Nitrosomonas europaea]HUM73159.1 efflux RND transporter periplasmic adaptor subunit [Nitrosomonas europaea]
MSTENKNQVISEIDYSSSNKTHKHSLRNTLLIIVTLAVIAFMAYRLTDRNAGGTHTRPAAAVGTASAIHTDMPVMVTALGTVQPLVTATVRPQLSGVLFKLMFQEGQMVRVGQMLAQIDPRPYRLALAQAKADLARDEAQLAVARLDLKRYETLLSQDSIASQQVDTQRALVRQLTGTVAADRAAIGTAELNLEYTAIKSPIDGRVGIRQVDIGNYLTPSDTNGIVVITQLDPIDVSFFLPQTQLSIIGHQADSGAGLLVQALDQNDSRILAEGRFLAFDNQVDTTTGTVRAKARFDNGDNTLFPGQFVNISLLVTTLHDAVTVPISAVRHGVPGDFVFVVQPDDTVRLTPVMIGPSADGQTAITSGLTAGAIVVTDGADGLEDGSPVRLTENRSPDDGKSHQDDRHQSESTDQHS